MCSIENIVVEVCGATVFNGIAAAKYKNYLLIKPAK